MNAKKFSHFVLRIYDNYVEINKSSHGGSDTDDIDLYELWDFLEENFKLPIPVLTTYSKCYSFSPEAQLDFGEIAKKYYSAIAMFDENNVEVSSDNIAKDLFLEGIQIKTFELKEDAVSWLEAYGPIEKL